MLKLAVLALALGCAASAHAIRCYWATEPAIGWDGPGIYAGKACYTDDGLQELYFKPIIPVVSF